MVTGRNVRIATITVGLYLSAVFMLTAWTAWKNVVEVEPYSVGDWLINYHGGFVRRGLFGEFSLFIYRISGFSPLISVFLFQLVCYGAFFIFSFILIARQDIIWPFYILIFSPYIFDFQLFGGGFRKEIVLFALMSAVAWSTTLRDEKYFLSVYYFSIVIYPIIILMHEVLFVMLPYIISILFLRIGNPSGFHKKISFVLFSASLLAFVSVSIAHPDWDSVRQICDSLGANAPRDCATLDGTGAISWLGLTFSQALSMVFSYVRWGGYPFLYPLTLMMVMIGFAPAYRHLALLFADRTVAILLVSSVAMTAGVALVALDWGRLIYMHAVSLFLLCLSVGNRVAIAQTGRSVLSQGLSGRAFPIDRRILVGGFFLFLLMYSASWNIRGCCGEEMGQGLLYLLREAISAWL